MIELTLSVPAEDWLTPWLAAGDDASFNAASGNREAAWRGRRSAPVYRWRRASRPAKASLKLPVCSATQFCRPRRTRRVREET